MVPAGGHIRTSSPNRIVKLNPQFGNSNFVSNDVPGLGFDYPHLAAVGPKRGQNGRGGFGFRQTVPFGFGGQVIRMRGSGGGYEVYTLDEDGWSPSEPVIDLGEAFWCRNPVNPFIWNRVLPTD